MRVMLVVAYRVNEMAAKSHPFGQLRGDLVARGLLSEIKVRLLTVQDVRQYVLFSLGDDKVPSELPLLVHRKTEGNPLFMTDLVRYLQDHGTASRDAVEMTRDVPESLSGMIERTLQALDSDARSLLRVAALQGNEFESAIVARIIGRKAVDVEEQLQVLARVHGLVAIVKEHPLPDGTFSLRCRFVHVLYQNALYASTTPSRRAEWARQIAVALASSYTDRTELIASELAVLFEIARDFGKSAEYFLTASKAATGRFAFREASDLARRGLQSLSIAGPQTNGDTSRLEFDLTFALFVPLASVGGYGSPDTQALADRLLQLCDKIQDTNATSAALAATGVVYAGRGECLATEEVASRLISIGRSTNNDVFLMNGHMLSVIAFHHMGRFSEADKHGSAIMLLDERGRDSERRIAVLDPVVVALSELSRNAWIMGCLKRAPQYAERAVEVGRRVRDPDALAFAWLFDGFMHGCRQNWMMCLKSLENGIAVASEGDSAQTLAWNRCGRGWVTAHLGRVDEGLEELVAAIESSKRIWGQVCMSQLSTMAAQVLLLKDDIEGAQTWLSKGFEISERHAEHFFDAELHRLSAVCLLKRRQRDAARVHIQTALDIARSQEAAIFELRAGLVLAEYDLADWRRVLTSVLGRFPEPEPWPEVLEAKHSLQ